MAAPTPLPGEADRLACIATERRHPQSVREEAWRELLPIIERLAETVARTRSCDELRQEAVSLVWQRLSRPCSEQARYDPNRGGFQSWCHVILARHAVDLQRRKARQRGVAMPHCGVDAEVVHRSPESQQPTCDQLIECRNRLRTSLDELACTAPATSARIDYYAVLLVQLRLAAAKLLHQAGSIDVIERFLPWTAPEPQRSFKTGWPTLATIWDNMETVLLESPHWMSGSAFCDLVSQLLPAGACLTEATWLQWVRRAKTQARQHVAGSVWDECFTRLLPDRSR